MKKSLLIICAALSVGLYFQSCKKSKSNTTPTTVTVSGLFSLTGNWSTLGVNSKAALQFAADDINAYLQSKNANFRMAVTIYDTKLDAGAAKADFLTAAGGGSHFIIGPQSSAELAAIIPSADAAQTIVISQGSTAGSLAIAGDPVFRFCPPDKVEGEAIANTIFQNHIQGLITVARNDAGNTGLQSAVGTSFISKGGVINDISPYSDTTTDFTSLIASIKAKVTTLSATYGIEHTGIYLASFDEGAMLFAQAASDSQLSQVKWYGGDGIVLSSVLLTNTTASKFAARTGFFAPSFGLPEALQSKWQPVADRIKASTGIDADAFALSAYDAMWVIAYTLESTKGSTSDFTQLKTTFEQQSNSYTGITGPTALDSFGDRGSGSFDYFGIIKVDTGYKWTLVGRSE